MLFLPLRSSLTSPSVLSSDSWVEIRLWPMPSTSCNSATESDSFSTSLKIRRRVGSERSLRDFSIDAMRVMMHQRIAI